ncbi:MAG: hypothetical protein JWQ76_4051 [Ramlibacter sp.]|nr:hypothetical protein [Ramlibacter sp.]
MFGCGSCGAQARRDDRACPICRTPLAPSTVPGALIPVRRYGEVPPYPIELGELLEDDGPALPRRGRPRLQPYAVAALSALMLAACAGYWLR